MPIAKRTVRVQLSGGVAQDVDSKVLPDGAITEMHNLYYDKTFRLRRRLPRTSVPLEASHYPTAIFTRHGAQHITARHGANGGVFGVELNFDPGSITPTIGNAFVAESTSLVTSGALSKLEIDTQRRYADGSDYVYIDVTRCGGYTQRHSDTEFFRVASGSSRYVKAKPAGSNLHAYIYGVSSTAPDGWIVGDVNLGAFYTTAISAGIQSYCDVCVDSNDRFYVVWRADTTTVKAYNAELSDPTSAITDQITHSGMGLQGSVHAGAFDELPTGAHHYIVSAIGPTGTVQCWLPQQRNFSSSTSVIHSAGPTITVPAVAGNGIDGSWFAHTLSAASTTNLTTRLYNVQSGTTGLYLIRDIPSVQPQSRPVEFTDTLGTIVSAIAVGKESAEGIGRGALLAGNRLYGSLFPLAPQCSYSPGSHAAKANSSMRTAVCSNLEYEATGKSRVYWADHEYAPGANAENTDQTILGYAFSLTLGSRVSMQPQELHGSWYYSGGVAQHDGGEVGFLYPPDGVTASGTSGTGLSTTRVYSYQVVYEWTGPDGRREQSAPSVAATCEATGAVALRIPHPGPSSKSPLLARVYRDSQLGGAVHHEVASVRASATGPMIVVDYMADSTAAVREVLYTDQGLLEHWMPQISGSTAFWSHRGRLWCADGNLARFSNEAKPTEMASWYDAAYVRLPSAVVAFASWGDALVILCSGGIYVLTGDGPTPDGNGPYPPPYQIPGARGCSLEYGGQRSVAVCSAGITYRSDRGLELLSGSGGSLSPQELGGPVQDELEQRPYVVSATNDQEAGFVRFATCAIDADGQSVTSPAVRSRILAWEYDQSAEVQRPVWHTEDAQGIGSYVLCGGMAGDRYGIGIMDTAPSTVGTYVVETTGSSGATGYVSCWLTLGRIRPGEGAGWGRVYEWLLLGETTSSTHTMSVWARYDDNDLDILSAPVTYVNGASNDHPIHFTASRQKCHHVVLSFGDTGGDGGSYYEGYRFNALTATVGKLPGMRRLPASNRV